MLVDQIAWTDAPADAPGALPVHLKNRTITVWSSALFPALGDLKFEHAWRGTIAITGDHIPKIVAFGPNAYACFGYSGRGIGPGTIFGIQAAIALLERNPEVLPLAPVHRYSERYTRLRAAYYEAGATIIHAVDAAPFYLSQRR
jgi:glycine/D-amino acid oxidase-like deaminating enzyme